MSPTKPQDFPLLLEVFRDGLTCGLISKDQIVAWADNIIKNESEPDYFFIELSLSTDTNSVAEIFDQYVSWSGSAIPLRVLMGLIYQRLRDGVMNVDKAVGMLEEINSRQILPWIESGEIYSFEDYEFLYPPNLQALKEDVFEFLSVYEYFNLANYDQWPEINNGIEEILKEKKIKADAAADVWKRTAKKNATKRKLKKYALLSIPLAVLLFVIILNLKLMRDEPTVSKLFADHDYIFFLDFFVFYSTIRIGYKVWAKRRRVR